MSSALDMSLDDLIKNNKKSGSRGGGRGRGSSSSGPGPSRRLPNRAANRPTPYAPVAKAPETAWQHDMFANQAAMMGLAAARLPSIETGTKLYVSNLDYGVSNEDIKELFSEVGDLKRYSIHYDRSGRSKGTAEVVFSRRADAVAAVKRYNNVQLDGKLMKIEIVGTNVATPGAPAVPVIPFGNTNGVPRGGQGIGGAMSRLRRGRGGGGGGDGGGGGGGRGFGRGRGRRRGGRGEKVVSAEDLDADLEKYHSEAVDIETETN